MDNTVRPEMGPWIYALMAKLEKPLYPDVESELRNLIKDCREQRVKVVKDGSDLEIVNSLTLFICLAAKYFGQKDLGDLK